MRIDSCGNFETIETSFGGIILAVATDLIAISPVAEKTEQHLRHRISVVRRISTLIT